MRMRPFIAFIAYFGLFAAGSVFAEPREVLFFTDIDPNEPVPVVTSSTDVNSQLLAFYEPYLQDFKVRQRFVTSTRAWQLMQQRPDVCRGKNVRTAAREEFAVFSDLPQMVFPPLRLYMRADHPMADTVLARLDASGNGHLPLDEILALDQDLVLGLVRGRSYTPALDAAIDLDEHSQQLWIRAVQDQSSGLFEMLINERIDFTLHTSVAVKRFLEQHDKDLDLVVVPLAEATDSLLGYAMCSQSELGRAFMDALNTAIASVSQQRAYFDMHMSWVPQAERPHLARLYNEAFGTSFEVEPSN